MTDSLGLGVMVAIVTGALLAVLSSIEGLIGRAVGAINASLLEHLVAGLVAIIGFLFLALRGNLAVESLRSVLPQAALAGVIVVVAVAGIAYAMPRIGVVAGTTGIVFGQMLIVVLIDTLGLIGYQRIPLSAARIIGLLFLAGGTYLVLPRGG